MRVTVDLLGVLGGRRRAGRALDLELPEGLTAGELLRRLADRCGAPFREAVESPDPRLPRHIRMFADGEMVSRREQVLAAAGAGRVTVVLLTPMVGG